MTTTSRTRTALVGCGYVADFYLRTLPNHPGLELTGVFDRDADRAAGVAASHRVVAYRSLDELTADHEVSIVVNLTNPRNHHDVSRACLEAGKHVYSEKPLATSWPDALGLVELAEARGLSIASAPCNVLGESAQTLWRAVRQGVVGTSRLVYAEIDDGMVHRMGYRNWISESGKPWPFRDEFEVGCTLEHAGYYLSWLAASFGPATSVSSLASCQIPDKAPGELQDPADAPDFSVAVLRFASGVVARLTCSIVAPHDHSLRVVGDDGVLTVDDCWDYGSPVRARRRTRLSARAEKYHLAGPPFWIGSRVLPLVRRPTFGYRYLGANRMDFCRGIADLAEAIDEGRPCRLSARFSLHVNEIALAIHDSVGLGCARRLTTSFEPMKPMPWAVGPRPRRGWL